MDALSSEIKRYLSIYNKNTTTDNNLEISFGKSLGKYIFDTNVSNKYWKKVYNMLEKKGDFTLRKDFTYRIYTSNDKRLYIDKDDKMRCTKRTLMESCICYKEEETIGDMKITLYNKKLINTAKFPSLWDYDNAIRRETLSYHFNGFYINLSVSKPLEGDGEPIHNITIMILSKNNKVSRNILIKNIMKQIHDIYTVFNLKDVSFKTYNYGTE